MWRTLRAAAVAAQGSAHLHLAARVGGDDFGRRCLHGVERFAVAKLVRHLLADDVVDSGAAAAERGLFHLDQLETGDRLHQVAWLAADALGVHEMTRLLVGHSARHGFGRRHELALGEILGEVAHAIAESLRALGIDGIVLQQVAIFLEGGAAAGGRDDDRVIAGLPRRRRCSCAPGCAPPPSCRREHGARRNTAARRGTSTSAPFLAMTRAAARFVLAKTVPMMQPLKSRALRDSLPNRVGQPAFVPGDERAAGDLRRQRLQIVHPQQLQQAGLARERGDTALLGEAKHADQEAQPAAIGEEPIESNSAQRALAAEVAAGAARAARETLRPAGRSARRTDRPPRRRGN